MSARSDPILVIDGLQKSFDGLPIMRGINLTVHRGERHAVIGPNGAGKSTLFNLISGDLEPSAGTIRLNGRAIGGLAPERINRLGLARSFQITSVFGRLSAFENIRIGIMARHRMRFDLFSPYPVIVRSHNLKVTCKPISLTNVFAETGGLPVAKRHPARLRYRILELQRWRDKRGLKFNLHPTARNRRAP